MTAPDRKDDGNDLVSVISEEESKTTDKVLTEEKQVPDIARFNNDLDPAIPAAYSESEKSDDMEYPVEDTSNMTQTIPEDNSQPLQTLFSEVFQLNVIIASLKATVQKQKKQIKEQEYTIHKQERQINAKEDGITVTPNTMVELEARLKCLESALENR